MSYRRCQSVAKTSQASHQITNPRLAQPILPIPLVIGPKPHAGPDSVPPEGEEPEFSGDGVCLLVLEAQVRG